MSSQKNVAVVLSGCGVFDGTEVHEASSCLIHLSRAGTNVTMFAPDVDQMHVINHLKGEVMPERRNVLVESGRIGRGQVSPLSELEVGKFDALVVPGGFGAAKNLSDFAVSGADCSVQPDVGRVLREFHSAQKPIALCCIAPTLAAKVIAGAEVTMGQEAEAGGKWPHAAATQAVAGMGGRHVAKDVLECHVDAANRLVTSPAFMCETAVHQVYEGIGEMIRQLLRLA